MSESEKKFVLQIKKLKEHAKVCVNANAQYFLASTLYVVLLRFDLFFDCFQIRSFSHCIKLRFVQYQFITIKETDSLYLELTLE